MENKHIFKLAAEIATRLQTIDFDKLPISSYNKDYIRRIKYALHYYMQIYASCIITGIRSVNLPINEISFVDFGGGSGFLSILASSLGFRNVIYVDINPKSVNTINVLKNLLGAGPNVIIEGSAAQLNKWCRENSVSPQLLIATDLIEHVYDLDSFFEELSSAENLKTMLFTTASTPYNPMVKRRLHKTMIACEKGNSENPNYYNLRFEYIKETFPDLSDKQIRIWAEKTRGLIYSDIKKAIESDVFPILNDRYNTCDPRNGNWTERILPISYYRMLGNKFKYNVSVGKGFYNTKRNNKVFSTICHTMNTCIRHTGKFGFIISPFITLTFSKDRT